MGVDVKIQVGNRGRFTNRDGTLTDEARETLDNFNQNSGNIIFDGEFAANTVLYSDVNGVVKTISLSEYQIVYGGVTGIPQALTFPQERILGTLAADGLKALTSAQVTGQLDLSGMVGKTAGVSVADAVDSTVDVTGSDAVDSTVNVTNPDAPAAAVGYSQTDTQDSVDLTNEMKADINQLVTDVNSKNALINEIKADVNTLVTDLNNSITQLNALLTSLEGGSLIAT